MAAAFQAVECGRFQGRTRGCVGGTAVEVVLDLAVYGLLAMTEKHSATHKQVMTLQVLSGHLANVLKGMGESEGIGRIREDRKAVAEVIDKAFMFH